MSSQSPNPSEQQNSQRTDAETSTVEDLVAPVAKTGNLADMNPDEYKHEHGEHHHHHHHHRHHHRHFHIFNFSISGIRDNLKLLFKSIYTYPYMLLFLSFVFLFLMSSGMILAQLTAHKDAFSLLENYYRWQELLIMRKAFLIRIPFQLTLLVSIGITVFLMKKRERHWQRNVMKLLPALGAAAIFAIPLGARRNAEEFSRSSCRDCLRNYYAICLNFANRHDGSFPKRIPRTPSNAAEYGSDHYIYHGANKKENDEPFILLEDKAENHVGNYRYAIRNDGILLVSKYGGLYEEFKNEKQSGQIKNLPGTGEDEEDFWDENLDMYLNTSDEGDDLTQVEGTIEKRSILPSPQESDYPDCRFTAHFIGNTIISGQPCPKEINLIIDGFEDYEVLDNDRVKDGDKVLCTLIPFDKLSEEEQSTQQADDLELYLLENYYAVDIKIIDSFSDDGLIPSSGILFSDGNNDYISIFNRHINPAVSQKNAYAQTSSIQSDLDKMNRLLEGFNEDRIMELNEQFAKAWKDEQEKDAPGYNRIGDYVWRNIDNSFWTLPEDYILIEKTDELSKDMLDCFSSLKKALEANGVQFIISLVPNYNVISSRIINKQFRDIPDIQTAVYVKQLSEIGIETIYASDSIIRNFNKYPFAFFFPSNPHPSDTAQDVLSDLLAERLKRYNVSSKLNSQLFSVMQSPHSYKEQEEYLFPRNCDIGNNKEGQSYTCRKILYNKADIAKSKDSPIIVIGNSYIQTPVSPPESLPALLSYKLRTGIDWYRISGLGPFSDIIIRLLTSPETYLKGKKVLIMQVGTDHLTKVNRKEIMLDIAQQDRERVLLNNKKMKKHYLFSSNVNEALIKDEELWGPLSKVDKTVFRIDQKEVLEFSFIIEQTDGINTSKPMICFIPHACLSNAPCVLSVNGQQKTMNCFNLADNAKFFNLAFELPAGTKKITIKATGKEGSLFAIKDIQIWQ